MSTILNQESYIKNMFIQLKLLYYFLYFQIKLNSFIHVLWNFIIKCSLLYLKISYKFENEKRKNNHEKILVSRIISFSQLP